MRLEITDPKKPIPLAICVQQVHTLKLFQVPKCRELT
jgi:hypothetical protein